MPSSLRRKSSAESYWREQVARWRASGLSQVEYSRQTGLSINTLGYWKRRLDREGQEKTPASSIVAVPISQHVEQPIPRRPIVIHVGRGLRVEIGGDFHQPVLEKILRTVEDLA